MAEILERSGFRVKIRVEVPAKDVSKTYSALVAEYSRRIKVPGFRPGKAPAKVVEARLDREGLLQEVKEKLLDETYPKAVRELELVPVGVQLLEAELLEGQDFVYVAEVENYPDVTLPNWRDFRLDLAPAAITAETVEQALNDLRERYGELETVERAIEATDNVFIETDDGARLPVDMKTAQPHVVEALLGRSIGETVSVPVKDGEVVLREIPTKILEVKALKLPELDDEFAKTVGEEDLTTLRSKVEQSLHAQAARQLQEAKIEQLTVMLAEGIEVEIPPTMQAEEERAVLSIVQEDLQKQKLELQDYINSLTAEGKLDEFKADIARTATTRLRRALAREALAEELGTEFSDEEWEAYLNEMARAYRTNIAGIKKELGERTLVNLREQRKQDKAVYEALQKIDL